MGYVVTLALVAPFDLPSLLDDIFHMALSSANIPAWLEPASVHPDGTKNTKTRTFRINIPYPCLYDEMVVSKLQY